MAKATLKGKRVAIIATDMVEEVELVEPRKALENAGAATELISLHAGEIQSLDHFEKAGRHHVDREVADADPSDYDALMIPGGVGNPDAMRTDETMIAFTRDFFEQGKPVAAICHAPWMLVEAGVLTGRRLTSWPSLETDIRNAGGDRVDQEGRGRRRAHHQPKARRHPRIQPHDDRAVRKLRGAAIPPRGGRRERNVQGIRAREGEPARHVGVTAASPSSRLALTSVCALRRQRSSATTSPGDWTGCSWPSNRPRSCPPGYRPSVAPGNRNNLIRLLHLLDRLPSDKTG